MRRRHLTLIFATAFAASAAFAAPVKTKAPAPKNAAAIKPPPAPPKGKATFPLQKHRNPPGKIIKIFPGDKHLDPKALAAAPTATQVAAKKLGTAVVKPPEAAAKPKRPAAGTKTPRP